MRRTKAPGPLSHDVHLLLLGKRIVDKSGKYVGPLPAEDDLIDVRCRSRRIHPARVTHVDQDARFPIWATEIEIPPSGVLEQVSPDRDDHLTAFDRAQLSHWPEGVRRDEHGNTNHQ